MAMKKRCLIYTRCEDGRLDGVSVGFPGFIDESPQATQASMKNIQG